MEQILITKPNGDIEPIFRNETVTSISKAEHRKALLGEDIVYISVDSAANRNFGIGDKIQLFGGNTYRINQIPKVEKRSERMFSYELIFEGLQYDLIRALYLNEDVTQFNTSGEFNLTGDIEMFLNVLINNANRVFGADSWALGAFPTGTETKNLLFNNENSLAVLQRICTEYDYQFVITEVLGQKVLNVQKLGADLAFLFQYGKGKGLYNLQRTKVDSKGIVNRLYVYGSQKNIPSNYKNYADRLRLGLSGEQSVLEDTESIAAFGLFEGIFIDENVYPHRTGTVSAINTGNRLEFTDSSMDFNLNDYLVSGNSAKIHFNSGNLAGYELEITKYNDSTKTFTIKAFKDPKGLDFPSTTESAFFIQTGDEYVIIDIIMPETYINTAEALLLEKGQAYLNANKVPTVQYTLELDYRYLKNNSVGLNIFEVGDTVMLKDFDLSIDSRIKIIAFTRDILNPYHYNLTIADLPETGAIRRLVSDSNYLKTLAKLNDLANIAKAKQNYKSDSEIFTSIDYALSGVWALIANALEEKGYIGSTNNFDIGIKRNDIEKVTIKDTEVEFADQIKANNPATSTAAVKILVDEGGVHKTRTASEILADIGAGSGGGGGVFGGGIKGDNVTTASKVNETLSGLRNVGGKIIGAFDTLLLAGQTDESENGIYKVGLTWTARTAAEANPWLSVAYGNGVFVAVTYYGTNQVMTSPDGITWTGQTAANTNGWYSVTFGNGLFVAISYNGTNQVMTSPDGITWTARTAVETNEWISVCYGNGLFVAVGFQGTYQVMTSPDGVTWTGQTAASSNGWWSVCFGNGLFVATAISGTDRVMTSPDGITWTTRTPTTDIAWVSVAYGKGLFVAVASFGTGDKIMTSPDGVTWTGRTTTSAGIMSVAYGNGVFVTVENYDSRAYSFDGINWLNGLGIEGNQWRGLCYGNGLFVATAIDGTNRVATLDGGWSRPISYNDDEEIRRKYHLVEHGTFKNKKIVNTNESPITVGTTAITYEDYQDIEGWNLAAGLVDENGNLIVKTLTTAEKNAYVSPTIGMIILDTTLSKLCFYTGSAWQTITSS